jgi:acyl carrier protein
MTDRDEIMAKTVATIADTFLVDPQSLTPQTSAVDVPGWDSVSQVSLVMRLEDEFHIQISATALNNIPNIGGLVDFIAQSVNRP